MLLTLQKVVEFAISFVILLMMFIFIAANIFVTLYQNDNILKWGDVHAAFITLYDSAINYWDMIGMGEKSVENMVVQTVYVFIFNVILLNYLIAIMASTYE